MDAAEYSTQLTAHYVERWKCSHRVHRLARGPVHELPERFRVLVFDRSAATKAYATICMSDLADAERVELFLLTRAEPDDSDELVELLTAVAHYHRTGASLRWGDTVNFGRPWLPGSRCDRGLLSLPYLDGPDLEWMREPRVRFLWLIPVTAEEVEFKKTNGLEALEKRLELTQFDYLDPARKPAI